MLPTMQPWRRRYKIDPAYSSKQPRQRVCASTSAIGNWLTRPFLIGVRPRATTNIARARRYGTRSQSRITSLNCMDFIRQVKGAGCAGVPYLGRKRCPATECSALDGASARRSVDTSRWVLIVWTKPRGSPNRANSRQWPEFSHILMSHLRSLTNHIVLRDREVSFAYRQCMADCKLNVHKSLPSGGSGLSTQEADSDASPVSSSVV